MDLGWYETTTLKQMMEHEYKLARSLRNGNAVLPRGIKVRVIHKFNGLTIETEECQHCGVRVVMSHVGPSDLEPADA